MLAFRSRTTLQPKRLLYKDTFRSLRNRIDSERLFVIRIFGILTMDLESRIELQKIDCNCNDCKFMIRDFEKYKKSRDWHYKLQLDYFTLIKEKTEDTKMRFEFDSSVASINYGHCEKFNKPVSFIPNTCQLETQQCFEHRRK